MGLRKTTFIGLSVLSIAVGAEQTLRPEPIDPARPAGVQRSIDDQLQELADSQDVEDDRKAASVSDATRDKGRTVKDSTIPRPPEQPRLRIRP